MARLAREWSKVELEFTSSVALDVSPDGWRLPTERRSTRDHRIGRAATR
jgi:hypothetical protein